MALFRLPLLVLITLIPLLPTASASYSQVSQESTTARRYHDPSPASTATVHFHRVPSATPSVQLHQNHLETEESQSMLALDRFTQDSPGEAMAAMGAAARPALLVPPQAAAPLSPRIIAAPDLEASQARPRPAAAAREAEEPASTTAAPSTALLPFPYQRTAAASARPPAPIQADVARVVALDSERGLLQLARVLSALGYNEMATGAKLLAKSPPLARWPWPRAITVFAVPDIFLQASCSMCSRRRLLLRHIALGYYPFSKLTANLTMKIPSTYVYLCFSLDTEPGFYVPRLFIEGVEVSHPEVYNDDRFVVHGLHGFLQPFSLSSCFESSPSHHSSDHTAVSSAATSISVVRVRITILEAIVRLRDGVYSFMARAMRLPW